MRKGTIMNLSKIAFLASSCFILAGFSGVAVSGPYTALKDNACPKGWEDTKGIVPVIPTAEDPWGVISEDQSEEELAAASAADKALALEHITPRAEVQTIDGVPITPQDKVDDLLTVASECLVYRNLEVDTVDYVAPVAVALDTSLGWLPAAIY